MPNYIVQYNTIQQYHTTRQEIQYAGRVQCNGIRYHTSTAGYSAIQYTPAPYGTIQYNAREHGRRSPVQCSTTQPIKIRSRAKTNAR
eukprot:4378660-Lingulodinium_polyedra.AAC.1